MTIQLLTIISVVNTILLSILMGLAIYKLVILKQLVVERRKDKLELEQRVLYTNRVVSDKLGVLSSGTSNQESLEQLDVKVEEVDKKIQAVQVSVNEVGEKADASYNEANHANLKIQAVLDVIETNQGKPTTQVTAKGLRDEHDKGEEEEVARGR